MKDEAARTRTAEAVDTRQGASASSRTSATGSRVASAAELRRLVAVVNHEAEALEDRVGEFLARTEAAALLRLYLSVGLFGLLGFALYSVLPPVAFALGLPVVVGLLVVIMRLDHVGRWLRRLFAASSRRLAEPTGRGRLHRWVVRPFLHGLAAIERWTGDIEDDYVRAGVGGAATIYLGGGAVATGAAAVGAALFAAYILVSVLIALIVIALFIAALIAMFGSK